MKELVRLLGYGLGSVAVILLLLQVASGEAGSGGGTLLLAILLVVVMPVVLGIMLVNRAKRKEAQGDQ